MKSTAGWQGSARGSLIVDEVGIEFGSCGKFRLRCFYEPVFERRGCLLHRVALEGAVMPFTAGRQVPYPDFLKSQHSHDPYDVELMRQVLQVRNYRNIGVGGPQLHLDLAPLIQVDRSRFPHALAAIAGHMRDIGLDPQLVVCTLASSIPEDWPGLTREIRKPRSWCRDRRLRSSALDRRTIRRGIVPTWCALTKLGSRGSADTKRRYGCSARRWRGCASGRLVFSSRESIAGRSCMSPCGPAQTFSRGLSWLGSRSSEPKSTRSLCRLSICSGIARPLRSCLGDHINAAD